MLSDGTINVNSKEKIHIFYLLIKFGYFSIKVLIQNSSSKGDQHSKKKWPRPSNSLNQIVLFFLLVRLVCVTANAVFKQHSCAYINKML